MKSGPLPGPDELAAPRDDVKVTIALSRKSIEFFKSQAKRHGTKYQRMIRELVDRYASQFAA
jgi:predicted DNA binding CopG/RHH family protein